MEMLENTQSSAISSSNADPQMEQAIQHLPNHEDMEQKCDINAEEAWGIIEVIAATGKYWHDWDILKSLLSFRLKQVSGAPHEMKHLKVLEEYPESNMVDGAEAQKNSPESNMVDGAEAQKNSPESNMVDGAEAQKNSLSGETYPELVKRLDEALLSFVDGPPFTLQRLCEILLYPKGTYKSLSKLALALEKNLLVTSTIPICTDPYPTELAPTPAEPEKVNGDERAHTSQVPNGGKDLPGDGDEEMVEADGDEDAMNTEMDTQEDQGRGTSESRAEPTASLCPSEEPTSKIEQHD